MGVRSAPFSETAASPFCNRLVRKGKALPTASVFYWKVMEPDGYNMLKARGVYIMAVMNKEGGQIRGEDLRSRENRIVANHQAHLGRSDREEDIMFAYSVKGAKEITDLYGSGALDPEFARHPGLEQFA